MAKKSKKQVGEHLSKCLMIPVFYHSDKTICKNVVDACYAGGIRVFEYTNRGEAAMGVFKELKSYISKKYPDMLLGMGSVLNAKTAEQVIKLGADFVVAPILDIPTAKVCKKANIYWIPGCGTVTEVAQAGNAGADIIKVFPGAVLGPEFIKSAKGPMPWLNLMPTGGVEPTKESLSAWFKAGAICVGMGSQLISNDILKSGEYKKLTEAVKKTFKIIAEIKG